MAPEYTACGCLSAVTTAQGWTLGTPRPLWSPPRPRAARKRKTGRPLREAQSRLHGRNAGATCRSPCPAVTAPGGGQEEAEGRPGSGKAGRARGGRSGWLAARDPARGARGAGRTQDGRERRIHASRPLRRGGTRDGSLTAPPHGAACTGDCCGPSLQMAKLRLREAGDQRPTGASLPGPPSAGKHRGPTGPRGR